MKQEDPIVRLESPAFRRGEEVNVLPARGGRRTGQEDVVDEDRLAPARGCVWGVLLSVPVWVAVGVGVWLWLR